jgi:hypothetical protein
MREVSSGVQETTSATGFLAAIEKKWFKKGSGQPANWAGKLDSRAIESRFTRCPVAAFNDGILFSKNS